MSDKRLRPMELKVFTRARAAAVLAIREDRALSPTARLVGIHVAEKHLNPRNNGAWPAFDTIGQAIGRSAKTVSRAVNDLKIAGHITTEKRGPRTSRRISYIMIEDAASLSNSGSCEEEQSCPDNRTDMSNNTGQKCPPNLRREPKKEPCTQSGLSFPSYLVPAGSKNAQAWEKALSEKCLPPLRSYAIHKTQNGEQVFVLPGSWPPTGPDSDEWYRTEKFFEDHLI